MATPPALHTPLGSLNATAAGNWSNATGGGSSAWCRTLSIPNELFLALGFASLVENVLVVAAIVKNRNLHSPMYLFICCLAVSDLLVSVSNLAETLFIVLLERGSLALPPGALRHMDNAMDMLICGSVVSSLAFLGAIAVDRYVTIFYALRYHSIVTMRRAGAASALIWVASAVSSSLFITYYKQAGAVLCLVAFFASMLLLMLGLYAHMFALAHRHSSRISRQRKTRAASPATSLRGAVTLTLLLGVFFVCWGPFFLHLTLIVTCPQSPSCACFFNYFNLFLILIICNSVIDPLIYAFRSRELRKTLQEVVLCAW